VCGTNQSAPQISSTVSRNAIGLVIALCLVVYGFVHYTGNSGKQLYEYYKAMDGNADRPGFNEQKYVNGKVLKKCKVDGKQRGYYGWFELRTVLLEGERIKNDQLTRLYIFALTDDDGHVSAIWRGDDYKQAVIDTMQRTCD